MAKTMLVDFETRGYATITMFEDSASNLLKMMGQSGTIPGAIQSEEVAGALQRLNNALQAGNVADSPSPEPANGDDDDDEPVSLKNRAIPLIQLLEAAQKQNASVTWQNQDQSL